VEKEGLDETHGIGSLSGSKKRDIGGRIEFRRRARGGLLIKDEKEGRCESAEAKLWKFNAQCSPEL